MNLKKHLAEVEKDIIVQTMQRNGGNKSVVAKELGISRATLYKKLREYLHITVQK